MPIEYENTILTLVLFNKLFFPLESFSNNKSVINTMPRQTIAFVNTTIILIMFSIVYTGKIRRIAFAITCLVSSLALGIKLSTTT